MLLKIILISWTERTNQMVSNSRVAADCVAHFTTAALNVNELNLRIYSKVDVFTLVWWRKTNWTWGVNFSGLLKDMCPDKVTSEVKITRLLFNPSNYSPAQSVIPPPPPPPPPGAYLAVPVKARLHHVRIFNTVQLNVPDAEIKTRAPRHQRHWGRAKRKKKTASTHRSVHHVIYQKRKLDILHLFWQICRETSARQSCVLRWTFPCCSHS